MSTRSQPRGRASTYATLMGSVVVTLLVSLLVPFAFGSAPTPRVTNDARAPVPSLEDADASASDPSQDDGAPAPVDGPTDVPGGSQAVGSPDQPTAAPSPTDPGSAGPSEPAGAGPGGTTARTASDVGVTPDTIEVAFLTASFSALARAGYGLDLGDEEGAYQAYVDEVNAAGGIHGRTIEPVYIPFDPADADDRRTACLEATEDHEVFATVNLVGMFGAGATCIAEEHDTPLLAYLGESDSLHARSGGRYVSFQMSKNTSLASMVLESHRLGMLEGRRIGVLDSEFPSDKEASEDGLLATLAELGYEVTHRHTSATNVGEAQAQIPVGVSEMQRKGVEVVLIASNFVAVQSFVNQAGSRNYFPQYLASDFGQIATDTGTSGFDGAAFDGAIGFSLLRSHGFKAGLSPSEIERGCMQRHADGTGTRYDHDQTLYAIVVVQCGLVDALVRALDAAGPELTRDRFTAAQLSFGAFQVGTLHPLSWGRDKYNGGDYIWTVQWQAGDGCPEGSGEGCWYPIDDVKPRPA